MRGWDVVEERGGSEGTGCGRREGGGEGRDVVEERGELRGRDVVEEAGRGRLGPKNLCTKNGLTRFSQLSFFSTIRAVLKREKKVFQNSSFACSSYVEPWLAGIGGWRSVAIGGWQLVAVGGWWWSLGAVLRGGH